MFGNIFYEISGTGKKIDVEAAKKRTAAQAAVRSHLPLEPHRAGRIRNIVLLGFICYGIGPIVGWVMAARDLKKMDLGRMDPSGRELTHKWRKIAKTIFFAWLGLVVLLILVSSCN